MKKQFLRMFLWGVCFTISQNIATAESKMSVFVSILPQKYFVQQIGRELVQVNVMVAPGSNPATYEPKPRQMAAISKTILYFSIGVPFENSWLDKIAATNPDMAVIETDHGIDKIKITFLSRDMHDNHHNEKHGHSHTGLDPHIWLSPPLVKIQAKTIFNALAKADPENISVYRSNYLEFIKTIESLDRQLIQLFENQKKLRFLVFHPSWGYFANAYGMEQLAIEVEGKEPKPAQLMEIINTAKRSEIKVIFVQPQFSTRNATLIAKEIGGRMIVADPLAEAWLTNMQSIAEKVKEALK